MVSSTVPRHLFLDYSTDFAIWLKTDYEINKNWYKTIDNTYDKETAKKTFKNIITNNKDRFIEESNSYSHYKIKYGFIKKIDKKIVELTIDYLINDFEINYLN